MIELTHEQRYLLHTSESPLRVIDPETHETFVLVRSEVYEQLKGLLGEDFHPSTAYVAVDQTFADGWNDPKMDEYDNYEDHRR